MSKIKIWVILCTMTLCVFGCKKTVRPDPVTSGEIEAHIRFLSDDLLEGRGMGSRSLALAALYHESCFRSLGLDPAFGESYRQPLTLIGTNPDKNTMLEIFADSRTVSLDYLNDFVVTSERRDNPEGVEGELVYGGYLIQAPERNWDDLKDVDVRGKVLLIEVNEPGNMPGGIFDGEDMTYYGRWTYKLEKASELGAAGALIIHNSPGAGYGWAAVRNTWALESFFLPEKDNRLFFQGWISEGAAARIFTEAGRNRDVLKAGAEKDSFRPVSLGLSARIRQKPVFRSVDTENVAAILRGEHPDHSGRTVCITAHYDHFGRDETLEGDQIYNGALDNCSASASMLALAGFYSRRRQDLKVDLLFAAVTAEEEGLLGSDFLARHLPVSPSNVLACLNFEMTGVWGETEDVYAIGARHSDLDDFCRRAAEDLDLIYTAERDGELGYFYRSDQISFVRRGIPAVWLHEGIVSKERDPEYIRRKHQEYRQSRYHKVEDEMDENWDLKGAVQIVRWADRIIALLGESDELPQFKSKSAFQR
jgi:Zn-dependent M28 family amino/carboxypeptidase